MHRRRFNAPPHWRQAAGVALALAWGMAAADTLAQTPAKPAAWTLRGAFEAAWSRQPEAAAGPARRDAAQARQLAAQAWTPAPLAVELAGKSDRLNRNLGTRELEASISVPLWLPGERGRSQALAQAERRAVDSHASAAQLRVAAAVREAWWNWQRARAEASSAQDQHDNARRLAADVGRRLQAGDLARADQHQADGAVAAADAAVAQAQAAALVAWLHLRGLTATPGAGLATGPTESGTKAGPEAEAEAEADPGTALAVLDAHAELLALNDRAAVAAHTAALAATQSRANPELMLAASRERGAHGEAWQQRLSVGVRLPFGAGPGHDARLASARADATELQAQLDLARHRLASAHDAAQAHTGAARAQLAAADRRAQLARESRGFFDKSFRLGETDLPTRLRIEAEAAEAERQVARARIALAAALSAWRQALGLLPQ